MEPAPEMVRVFCWRLRDQGDDQRAKDDGKEQQDGNKT